MISGGVGERDQAAQHLNAGCLLGDDDDSQAALGHAYAACGSIGVSRR